ncbi:hypothetical protein U0070_017103 [Myodes glareolus]|uniref:NADH dehydrogenase [ubiquinone] 1 beta subcomplex subunit 4 n=1 Tax=Myodes glareolus TaxID=447135 RepID=A0AAW0JIM5_MYOGA
MSCSKYKPAPLATVPYPRPNPGQLSPETRKVQFERLSIRAILNGSICFRTTTPHSHRRSCLGSLDLSKIDSCLS